MESGIRYERVYVRINASVDKLGVVHPTAIVWEDGRIFEIEKICDVLNGKRFGRGETLDCFKVMIRGRYKKLYLDRSDRPRSQFTGRWFVEVPVA